MERLIDHCTQNTKTQDDIQEYFEISDLAAQNPKEAVRLLTPRIFCGKNITSQKAANILKTCCLNSGLAFNRELSCKDFANNFKKNFSRLDENVQRTLFEVINEVEKDYKNDPSIDLLINLNTHISKAHPELYYSLRIKTDPSNHRGSTATTTSKAKSTKPERKVYQEDYELKKALELSLREASPMPARQEYPSLKKEIESQEEKVKALYDFEAVEENELNFKTGDLITLIDSSDSNWWKGKLNGKIGLFPVQFVSRETRKPSNGVSNEAQQVKKESVTSVVPLAVNKIDEDKLDKCLAMLNKLDENKTIKDDPQELISLEKECESMGPLVDEEIRKVEFQLDKITEMEENIVKVLSSYQEALEKQQTMINNQPTMPTQNMTPFNPNPQFYNGMQYQNQNVYPTPPMGYPPNYPPSYIASHPNPTNQPVNQFPPVPQYPTMYQPMDPNQIAAYHQFMMQQQQQQQQLMNNQNPSQQPNGMNGPSSNANP